MCRCASVPPACAPVLHIYEGQWEHLTHPELPFTLGHENAGWVEVAASPAGPNAVATL
jgi:D-arabinose 1-dehydrogenase-like Zn-dependent alcohol dehydrogenase